jgi:hypothetical protein
MGKYLLTKQSLEENKMKKLFIVAALALASVAATAGELSASVKYDYDRAEGSPWLSGHRQVTGLKYNFGALGAVDGGLAVSDVVVSSARVNGVGYDVGYSNGFKLGSLGFNGRVGYTHYGFAEFQGQNLSANVVSYKVEATLPLSAKVTTFVGAEHLDGQLSGVSTDSASANRYTIGADFAVAKNTALRVGYARLDQNGDGRVGNGLTSAISYKF